MSSLWTPEGEHRVPHDAAAPAARTGEDSGAGAPGAGAGAPPPGSRDDDMVDREALGRQVDEMRRELAGTPVEVVVANHCYGLFELAAVYLSQEPPLLAQATLAIDALGYLVDGLGSRLGEAEPSLREGLSQLRLAFVEIGRARQAADAVANGGSAGSAGEATTSAPDGAGTGAGPTA